MAELKAPNKMPMAERMGVGSIGLGHTGGIVAAGDST